MPVIFVQFLIKIEFSRQGLLKPCNKNILQDVSSGSRIVPCDRTEGRIDRPADRLMDKQANEQTDVTKLIDASRNFSNAPTNGLTVP